MKNEKVSPYLAMPNGQRYRQLLLKDAEIERLRAIITDIVKDGGDDPNSHAYLGEAMLRRIGASLRTNSAHE